MFRKAVITLSVLAGKYNCFKKKYRIFLKGTRVPFLKRVTFRFSSGSVTVRKRVVTIVVSEQFGLTGLCIGNLELVIVSVYVCQVPSCAVLLVFAE